MLKRALLALFLSIALRGVSQADPLQYNGSLTLNQAVARARDAGFEVRLSQADTESAQAQAKSARAQIAPQIGVAGTVLKADLAQLGMPVARQTYFSANAVVPIFAPSQWFAARAAGIAERGSEISVSEARNDAVYAVIQIYYRAQLARALVGARVVGVQAQQSHLSNTELRAALGKSARYLVARDRAALALAQQELEDASAQSDQALNDLKAALNYDMSSKLDLADTLGVTPFSVTQSEALLRAQELRPAVLAARHQMEAAQLRVRASQAQFMPTIMGSVQTYSGSSSPALGATGYQVGVTANLPIIDGGTRSAAVAQALADVHRTQTFYEELRLFAQRDVLNAFRELRAASTNLNSARAVQIDARAQLRVAKLREASGKGINLEVLDALTVDANARESILSAITRYDNAVAAVRHATGELSI